MGWQVVKAGEANGTTVPVALCTLPPLYRAEVLARPSRVVKSPYLADVRLLETGEEGMAHSPSLGCMGMVAAGATVLVSKTKEGSTAKSAFVIYHVERMEADKSTHLVGVHPTTANILARRLLEGDVVLGGGVERVDNEVTMGTCRFDFVVTHLGGRKTIVEVKNVPCADYADGNKPEKKVANAVEGLDAYGKMAIFPEGYKKKAADPVSPRALKHVEELQAVAEAGEMDACLLYIVQRLDCQKLVISKRDAKYREVRYWEAFRECFVGLGYC